MAVVSVPRPLQDRLGDDATASLVEMLRQLEDEQEERREVQKEHLFQLLEERFLRHVAESDHRTREELGQEIADLRKEFGQEIDDLRKELRQEIADVRKELGQEIAGVRQELGDVRKEISEVRKEISEVRKEISEVRKEITTQTRWILVVMGAAAVLIPIMQRVMETLIP
ncbi:MAG: hypothetical protein OXH96_02920 [Spirochaetaceae bacterium]|nr:hypothetical protein [Spirochaetaceae bacterium]